MIPDNEIGEVIAAELPELKAELSGTSTRCSIYQIVHALSELTIKFVQQRNTSSLIRCFAVAERLWKEGSQITRNAIENVFVYSVSTRSEGNLNALREVLSLLPVNLRAEYNRQHWHC